MNKKKNKIGVLAVLVLSVFKILHFMIFDPILGREILVNSTFYQVITSIAPGMNIAPGLRISVFNRLSIKSLDIFYALVLAYGLFRYFRNNEDKIGNIISITILSMLFIHSFLSVIIGPIILFELNQLPKIMSEGNLPIVIISGVLKIIRTIIIFIPLRELYDHYSNSSEFYTISKFTRVLHVVADFIIIHVIISPVYNRIVFSQYEFSYFIYVFLYYFFFELVFKTTPGKIFTNSRIIFDNTKETYLNSIFLRTVLRLTLSPIFSLFSSKIFHDEMTSTKVMKIKKISNI